MTVPTFAWKSGERLFFGFGGGGVGDVGDVDVGVGMGARVTDGPDRALMTSLANVGVARMFVRAADVVGDDSRMD